MSIPMVIGVVAPMQGRSFAWQLVVLPAAIIGIVVLWLRGFRVDVDDLGVSYKTLTSTKQTIEWSELDNYEFKIGVVNYIDRFRPTTRLVLNPVTASTKKQIQINAKVFRKDEIDQLIEVLDARLAR